MLMLPTIIAGCVANNRKYQKMLYEKYYEYSFKIAFRYIHSYSHVAPLVNKAFVKILNTIGEFEPKESVQMEHTLMEWIKKIVVAMAVEVSASCDHELTTENLPQAAWKNEDGDDRQLYKKLICHLKKLPWMQRAVFNMFVIDGFTHTEIAEQLKITKNLSERHLIEARANLQTLIRKEVAHAGVSTCLR